MSEPTLDEIAASVERLTDDSARLLQQQLMERLDPYRAGGGSPGGMVAGATPLNVARLISAGLVTADAIAAGAITADKLSVGLVGSRNLLVNGGFRDGLTGWTFNQNGDTSAFTILWQTDATWTLRDGDIDGWDGTGAPYGSSVSVMSTATTTKEPFLSQAYIPVTAGQVYSLSALVGNHRCTSVFARILWYDAANTYISAVTSTYYAGAKNGGPWYDGWERLRIEGQTAPATATNAQVILVATTPYTSGSNCYMFVDQVWFGAGAYAREFDPQEASRFHNSTGDVVIDSSGITINNGALTFNDETGSTMLDASGFGITWSKYITSGFYNSDFSSAPPTPASELNNTTNRLPGWSVTKLSGTAISCKSIAFSAAPSGRVVEFTVASGSTSDSTELSQMVPVFGAYGQSLAYTLTVVVKNNGTALPSGLALWVYAQGYQADGVTTTGSLTSYGVISGAVNALDIFTQRLSVPSDAGYMDVMVRLVRTGSASLTGSINVVGLGLVGTPGGLYLSESSDFTSREVGMVKQVDGALFLNGGYDTSGSGEIQVAGGSTGGITMLPGSAGTDHLGQLRSNESYLPYQMEVLTCNVTLSSAAAAYTDVTWVSGRFDVAPIVFVTMASAAGGSGKFVARAISTTTSGSRIYVYTGDQTSQSASILVDVLALQMRQSAADG
jgi:hypothetical protein